MNRVLACDSAGMAPYRNKAGRGVFVPGPEPTSMDAGAGGAFPSVDATARGTPDRPEQGNPPASDGDAPEPGSARAARRHPPDLDLPHRVRPRQPDLGQRAPDRDRAARFPSRYWRPWPKISRPNTEPPPGPRTVGGGENSLRVVVADSIYPGVHIEARPLRGVAAASWDRLAPSCLSRHLTPLPLLHPSRRIPKRCRDPLIGSQPCPPLVRPSMKKLVAAAPPVRCSSRRRLRQLRRLDRDQLDRRLRPASRASCRPSSRAC